MGREKKKCLDEALARRLLELVDELRKHRRCPSSSRRKLAKAGSILRSMLCDALQAEQKVPKWIIRIALRVAAACVHEGETTELLSKLR
jgi:hypothetical protein